MTKNKALYLLPLLAVIFLSSCRVMTKTIPVSSLNAQVNFSMDDLEYIGDVTGTATQTTLLGIIPVGGRRNHSGVLGSQAGFNLNVIGDRRAMQNALYDALMSKPDADFVLPISSYSVSDQMFLGNKETLTVRAKAFRLKTK